MGDDSPETVERRSEFAQLLRGLAPELREAVCQFLRDYEQQAGEQPETVLTLGEDQLRDARSEPRGDVSDDTLLRPGAAGRDARDRGPPSPQWCSPSLSTIARCSS